MIVEDGAIKNYVTTLAGLTEEELTVSLRVANRENKTDFAPGPGVVYDIAMEIRAGNKHGALAEMATWPEAAPHPDWIDDEWEKLKAKLDAKG